MKYCQESIVAGVSELRNIDSDAHAAGRKRFRISDYHARLVVNSAALMGEFILSVVKNRAK
ncbi:abortive infection family protein [Selenomonas montiformis]|uniref:abortive infection family protein n=1 Tax=Selenomonas montiformis TaxID=2652285 RepID=UPI003F8BC018